MLYDLFKKGEKMEQTVEVEQESYLVYFKDDVVLQRADNITAARILSMADRIRAKKDWSIRRITKVERKKPNAVQPPITPKQIQFIPESSGAPAQTY